MRKLGRPPVLDSTNQHIVCAIVAAGGCLEGAARYVGCAPSTVYRYLRRDEQFREKFQAARVQGALVPFEVMDRGASRNWRGGAWMLQQLHPERFDRAEIARRKQEVDEAYNRLSFRERMTAHVRAKLASQKSLSDSDPPAESHP
ncbi:MAG: hypothetical protein WD851_00150 [Pirellulales bacterium]